MYMYMKKYVCISKSPAGNPATVPDQVQDREADQDPHPEKEEQEEKEGKKVTKKEIQKSTPLTLFGCSWGAPNLTFGSSWAHLETLEGHFGYPGPQRTPKEGKGTSNEKRVYSGIFKRSVLGPPWGPLWDRLGDFFVFLFV